MTDHSVSIVIADDHPVFRRGLRTIIEAEAGFEVIGEANDGDAALALIEKTQPAIAILDIGMPKLDGLEIANRLMNLGSSVKIIFNTVYREEKLFKKALDAGVKGYATFGSGRPTGIDRITTRLSRRLAKSHAIPQGPAESFDPRRAGREKACTQGRLVSLY